MKKIIPILCLVLNFSFVYSQEKKCSENVLQTKSNLDKDIAVLLNNELNDYYIYFKGEFNDVTIYIKDHKSETVKKIHLDKGTNTPLNTQELKEGNYMIKVKTGDITKMFRIKIE